ncbi:YSIRK-type signal peptide-containing protein [Streptococcus dentapri]|uniref:YSIRK-type signal peptide-containing protein n=1 Tax=Streptococcus dentapri TaxID=573564 RepID=A0ABV8CZU8_9STRE
MEKNEHYSLRKLKFGLTSVAVAAFLSGIATVAQADEVTSSDVQQNNQVVSAQETVDGQTGAQQTDLEQTAVAPSESSSYQENTADNSGNSEADYEVVTETTSTSETSETIQDASAKSEAVDTASSEQAASSFTLRSRRMVADAATSRYRNTFVDDGQGNWYYLDNNGQNVTGSQMIDGKKMYFAQDGKQVKGKEVTIDNHVYYFDADSGEMWADRFHLGDDNQSWYYYGADGARVAGAQTIAGQKMYFDPETGKQAKGVLVKESDGKNRYYDTDSGILWVNRFAQINGDWYYLTADGSAAVSAQTIQGQSLYFREDGRQVKGDFVTFGGVLRYYDAESGELLRNTSRVIDGVTYKFDQDGTATAQTQVNVEVVKSNIVVNSYEFGPSVSKIILEFNEEVTPNVIHSGASVTTAGIARKILNSYVSDEEGHVIFFDSSKYVTLELDIPYDTSDTRNNASPFNFNSNTYRNNWVDSYTVAIDNLQVQVDGSAGHQIINSEQEAINNRLSPDSDRFSERGTYGALHYAAYQPESAKDGEKNPLIVWLHGIGEVGTDVTIPILAGNAVKLTEDPIQSHFTSTGNGDQKGAYVLVVQSPTSWSQTQASSLLSAIRSYVANHPDIDSNRIYLAGLSDGGGMVLKMGVTYPNYFAALVPIAAPADDYLTSDRSALTSTAANALKNQPMWILHTRADTTISADENALPLYKNLLKDGAQNKWLSYFETNVGTFSPNITYNGHWTWVYLLNDQVTGVQNPDNAKNWAELSGMVATNPTHGGDAQAIVNNKSYNNIFDWLNNQVKGRR